MIADGHDVVIASFSGYRTLVELEHVPFVAIADDPPFRAAGAKERRLFTRLPPKFDLPAEPWLSVVTRNFDALDGVVGANDVMVCPHRGLAAGPLGARPGIPWGTAAPNLWMVPTACRLAPSIDVASLGRHANRVSWKAVYRWIDSRLLGALNGWIADWHAP